MAVVLGAFSLDRVVSAVEKVRQRLLRATAALEAAKVPYAVAGGNAVALWVSRVDEAAVRNTQDVDVLIRPADLDAARRALEAVGFVYRHTAGVDVFLDGPTAKARDGLDIMFASESVRPHELAANPDVSESERAGTFRVLGLRPLVEMHLAAFGREDRMLLRDLTDVGLVDATWVPRLSPDLGPRLQQLLDDPNG